MRHVRIGSAAQWMLFMVAIVAVPSVAHAHVGVGQTSGAAHGFLHPLTGLDHFAAMVAVGLWAAQLGGRAVWSVPLTFVSVMAIGGLAGAAGVGLPLVETGIVASVLVLGLLIAAAARLPLVMSCLLVGLFAIFHGHAHGTELPAVVPGFAYGAGFMVATALLHTAGIGCGWVAHMAAARIVRYAGGAIAALGAILFLA